MGRGSCKARRGENDLINTEDVADNGVGIGCHDVVAADLHLLEQTRIEGAGHNSDQALVVGQVVKRMIQRVGVCIHGDDRGGRGKEVARVTVEDISLDGAEQAVKQLTDDVADKHAALILAGADHLLVKRDILVHVLRADDDGDKLELLLGLG